MVVDQFNDPRHKMLVKIAKERPDLIEMCKTASTGEDVERPPSAFADPSARRFPLHSPEQTVLSKLYAEKQASLVNPSVMERIDTALDLYGYDPESMKFGNTEKTASTASATQYLLPQYNRLVVRNKSDIPGATQQLFAQKHRLKVASLAEASKRLVNIAGGYDMKVDELPGEVYKYAGLTHCDAGELLDWVEARSAACPDLETRATFDKIAQAITDNFPRDGYIRNRNTLIKIASSLEEADEEAGITHLYGHRLRDPLETVFNTEKIAESMVNLGGQQVSLQNLMSIPAETYEEILGPGVIDAATGPDGQLDPEQFKALLETLPADLKSLLANTLAPHMR